MAQKIFKNFFRKYDIKVTKQTGYKFLWQRGAIYISDSPFLFTRKDVVKLTCKSNKILSCINNTKISAIFYEEQLVLDKNVSYTKRKENFLYEMFCVCKDRLLS